MINISMNLILFLLGFTASTLNAQTYLELREDGRIYDVDVVVFARQLSQPSAETINNKTLVKNDAVIRLPMWDGDTELFKFSVVEELPVDTVPIKSQTRPVQVLSDVILSKNMDHSIVNRLKVNPTYRPIHRQKWRQLPSAFTNPKYIEVNSTIEQQSLQIKNDKFNELGSEVLNSYKNDDSVISEGINTHHNLSPDVIYKPDFSIDGQVAFSSQTYNHLHVDMNFFRIDSAGQQIIYKLSQQKRIKFNEWQYFDHQQFGVLAKVTPIPLSQKRPTQ